MHRHQEFIEIGETPLSPQCYESLLDRILALQGTVEGFEGIPVP